MQTATPTARQLMNSSVRCVSDELSLRELIDFFIENSVSCAPVVAEENGPRNLLGFISQGDALSSLASQMFGGSPGMPIQVKHIMKRHPVAVRPETDVFAVASIFSSHGFRHVPVVDDQNQLLGLISRREILAALTKFFDQQQVEFDREHFPPDLHKIMNLRFVAGNG